MTTGLPSTPRDIALDALAKSIEAAIAAYDTARAIIEAEDGDDAADLFALDEVGSTLRAAGDDLEAVA